MVRSTDVFILTIDGPVGSGKGTIGQMIARHYGWHYLDSGALYRAFSYAANQQGISSEDDEALKTLINTLEISFIPTSDGGVDIKINGENVTNMVRHEDAGILASQYAGKPVVRELLFDLQKRAVKPPGLVADGRDMGSVVFPQANLKIYLTASAHSRAQRRYKQLKLKGFDVNLTRLVEDIQQRDSQDENRTHSPLAPAEDAIVLDTTSMNIDQVYARIVNLIDKKAVTTSL